ncbi:hypothetical protein VHEMI00606 [[Torrubiella] hemipterigena]|uniref:Uncharacterized protein n=1 Tax=[Torrubiella] hemipterigena TaxID=1531966 RepID=A0A0A1T2T5_9HYPO|nr:hypothetical protein VHEMI00606 [[Torrubiella] hemipterigena]
MEPNPELCKKYAQFASHMVRWQFKIIYWFMFITNLIVLFLASWIYTKGQQACETYQGNSHKKSAALKKYILLCSICVLVSTVIVTMEAYALLALQFCDGEDLMSLYWSTWTMMQIGSLIAIVGIILAMFHTLQDRRHPPWALALGTPVLVIAGFLHLFHDCTSRKVSKMRHNSHIGTLPSSSSTLSSDPEAAGAQTRPVLTLNTNTSPRSLSDATTVRNLSERNVNDTPLAEFVGFTTNGDPIVRFLTNSPTYITDSAEFIGYYEDEKPIVAFRKGSIHFVCGKGSSQEPPPSPGCGPLESASSSPA